MDTLIHYGGALKALGDGWFEGPLSMNGSPDEKDVQGEFFAPDTDYWEEFPVKKSLLYNHGLDKTLGLKKIGKGPVTLVRTDAGIWMKGQLDVSDAYEAAIYSMIEAGKMGASSGSAPHLVRTQPDGNARKITSWPIVEPSLTPTPADPRTKGRVVSMKSLIGLDTPSPWEPETDAPPAEEPAAKGLTLEERSEQLATLSQAFTDDMRQIKDLRAKEGRTLSTVNRERLRGHMETLSTVTSDMATLLDMAAPVKQGEPAPDEPAADLTLELDAEYGRLQETVSRLNGVPV